jgi:predicted transcriptional regulator
MKNNLARAAQDAKDAADKAKALLAQIVQLAEKLKLVKFDKLIEAQKKTEQQLTDIQTKMVSEIEAGKRARQRLVLLMKETAGEDMSEHIDEIAELDAFLEGN